MRVEIDPSSGVVTYVGTPTGDADIITPGTIFPGFIDLHVHAREDMSHAQDYKEDFKSAGEAALHGGVALFAEMPNNPIPPIDDASYEAKEALTKSSSCEVLLYALCAPGTKPLSKKVPYKAIIGGTTNASSMCFSSREELEETLSLYKGQHVSFHCEDAHVLKESESASTHEARRPKEAEISGVDLALSCIERFGIHGKICHVSTKEALEKIREAKKRGVDVMCEVTPHHLYFDEEMIDDQRLFQVNPPIRQSKENRLALIEGLKDGSIDFLATDHAPHTVEEKKEGISGLPQLDTYTPFVLWLMKEHGFTEEDVIRITSLNAGVFLSSFIDGKYGKIEEGYVGSLTILSDTPEVIQKEDLKTKCAWSPFEGVEFPGRALYTIVKGKIYENKR